MIVRYAYQRCIRCKSDDDAIIDECAAYQPRPQLDLQRGLVIQSRKTTDERLKTIEEQLRELLQLLTTNYTK